jgi:DNA topoisomerase III/RecQ family ATP-dependent DNA helicase
MTIAIVTEKPSVARDIAACVGARQRHEGYLEGNGWIVTWAIGHLVGLAQPHEIDPRWKAWRREQLPMLPARWPLSVLSEGAAQFGVVRRILRDRAIRRVVCATDAGREGELIFRFIYEAAECTKPVERLWISSLTPDAIQAGLARLRPAHELDGLADAARGRARADWLVGMNLSRAYTLSHGDLLSVGRVQTPTLALLVEREREIQAFVPEKYHEVLATFLAEGQPYQGTWFRADAATLAEAAEPARRRLPPDGELSAQIVARVRAAGRGQVVHMDEEHKRLPPPLLYDLSELQRHANRLYGMSAQRTLDTAQRLYEQRKLLTYPRTDSRHLSSDIARTLPSVVAAIAPRYPGLLAPGTDTRPLGRRFVDDSKVSDHHAIIPTTTSAGSMNLSPDEARIYDLVCRRLLSAWHDDHTYAVTQVLTRTGPEDLFHTRGSRVLSPGWKVLDIVTRGASSEGAPRRTARSPAGAPRREDEDPPTPEQALPTALRPNLVVPLADVEAKEKETRPPKRLTEANLLTAMETAGATLDDKELSRAMRERGLGTPATRAATIETLLARGYIERDGKVLRPTDKGMLLVDRVHPHVKSPAMTGEWEARLRKIERGELGLEPFMRDIEAFVAHVVGGVDGGGGAAQAKPGSAAQATTAIRPTEATTGPRPAQATTAPRPPQATTAPRPTEATTAPRPTDTRARTSPVESLQLALGGARGAPGGRGVGDHDTPDVGLAAKSRPPTRSDTHEPPAEPVSTAAQRAQLAARGRRLQPLDGNTPRAPSADTTSTRADTVSTQAGTASTRAAAASTQAGTASTRVAHADEGRGPARAARAPATPPAAGHRSEVATGPRAAPARKAPAVSGAQRVDGPRAPREDTPPPWLDDAPPPWLDDAPPSWLDDAPPPGLDDAPPPWLEEGPATGLHDAPPPWLDDRRREAPPARPAPGAAPPREAPSAARSTARPPPARPAEASSPARPAAVAGAIAPGVRPASREALRGRLQQTFGHSAYRAHQEPVCLAAAEGQDVLVVMPTGAGKSLCYQLPGLERGGTTVVISPLIALMEDQVAKLQALGLRAARIHSGRGRAESRMTCAEYLAGRLDYLFVAPERLAVPGFVDLLSQRTPSLVAVDEAHCISQWGHDFRPEYRMLGQRLPQLRPAPIIALTATATRVVQDDIVEQLGLGGGRRFIHGFRRKNIAIEVVEVPKPERPGVVAALLAPAASRPAIIYTTSRKEAEGLAEVLGSAMSIAPYHAGMSAAARDDVQREFLGGRIDVVAATIAFGMGVDKADIRTVVHTALPQTVEGYYQEIGRAGRDGRPSRAVLLHSFVDQRTHAFFLERSYPEVALLERLRSKVPPGGIAREELVRKVRGKHDLIDEALAKLWIHGGVQLDADDRVTRGHDDWRPSYLAQRAHREQQSAQMVALSTDHGCRMVHLVRHFGDASDSGEPCGLCDICAPERCRVQAFRAPAPHEVEALRALVLSVGRGPGRALGTLHRELEGSGRFPGLDRDTLGVLIGGLARAGLVELSDDSFEKGGETIAFQRVALTPAGRGVDDTTLARLRLPSALAPTERVQLPGKRRKKSKRSRAGETTARGRSTRARAADAGAPSPRARAPCAPRPPPPSAPAPPAVGPSARAPRGRQARRPRTPAPRRAPRARAARAPPRPAPSTPAARRWPRRCAPGAWQRPTRSGRRRSGS